jgi:hypothetical protein
MKLVKIFGCIILAAEFILCIIFYKERIFLDGAYYFFHVVQSQHFCIEHQRYILAISQLLPCLGSWFHLPLNALLILSSVNPVLYDAVLFYIIAYRLQHEGATWALLLNSCCGVYFLYFCPMYEVWYGTTWLIFFAALLDRSYFHRQPFVFDFILLMLLFAYPLIFIGAGLMLLLNFVIKKNFSRKFIIHLLVVVALWLLIKNLFISDYEAGKIEYPATRLTTTFIQNLGNTKNISQLFFYLLTNYYEAWITAAATIIFFISRKQRMPALIVFSIFICYLLLIGATQGSFWLPSNYNERMMKEWIELGTLPFFIYVYSEMKAKRVIVIFILATMVFRSSQIIQHSTYYQNRISEIETLISDARQQNIGKGFVDLKSTPQYASLDEWSLPMECLIFSSLQKNSSLIISEQQDFFDKDVQSQLNDQKFQLRLNEVFDDRWLNQRYFHLDDGPYRQVHF